MPALDPTEVHYVAELVVKKVTVRLAKPAGSYNNPPAEPAKREVHTIHRTNFSNPSLEKLIEKAGLHFSLVEDGGDIDNGKVTRG